MSASDRLDAELAQNSAGDWIFTVEGRAVAGIVWDDGPQEEPLVVVWDERGEVDGRTFSLFELFPDLDIRARGTESKRLFQ